MHGFLPSLHQHYYDGGCICSSTYSEYLYPYSIPCADRHLSLTDIHLVNPNTMTNSASSLTLQYVQPGACVVTLADGSRLATSCALEATECPLVSVFSGAASVDFVSSRQLMQLESTSPGYSCLNSNGSNRAHYVFLGRCVDRNDNFVCTSDAENCKRPEVFEQQDELCTLQADLSPTSINDRSFFASCWLKPEESDEKRCFWTGADCPEGSINHGADPYSNFLLCPCEDTETGACHQQGENQYICAVSSAGCDGSSVFLSVKQLQDQAGIDCRLCRTPIKIPDKLASAPISSPTTTTGGTTQGVVPPWDEGGNSSGMTRGALIAVAVSAGTLLGGVLVVSARRFRRRRNCNNARGGTAIVIETVDVNKNACDIADGTSLGSDRQA